MVKTLQKKFIAASMLAVTLLLLTLVGAINILNAVSVTRRQGRILEMLCETDAHPELRSGEPDEGRAGTGFHPAGPGFGKAEPGREDSSAWSSGEVPAMNGDRIDRRRDGGGFGLFGRNLSVDNALSARFFAVWFDEQGAVLRTDVSRIFAVDEEEAEETACRMIGTGRKQGTMDGFRFLVRQPQQTGEQTESRAAGADSGSSDEYAESVPDTSEETLLVAMDISADRDGILTVLGISVLIAALCWIAMLWPVRLLARRAIAPTATGIERQKQFVTNAGHELKTPLAIIQANTEALELFNGENKWTRNIKAQTVRLNGLMQNLLTLSRMDETGLHMELKPFPFAGLVREVWENFAASAEARNIAVRLEPGDEVLSVLGNRDSLAQLLSILFDNAVKYTPRGGQILIRTGTGRDQVVFTQSNTLSPQSREDGTLREDPERLFDRFYRADADRSRKKGGYGIGLSAAKAIASANQGSIHAAYEEDRLVFTVVLRAG